MSTNFGRNDATNELCTDVAVEKRTENDALLCGRPIKVLLPRFLSILIDKCSILSHCC